MSSDHDTRAGKIVGSHAERREDRPLLTGEASFTDDFDEVGGTFAAVLRSQFGHARIEEVDVDAARAREDVVAVYTADDVRASDAPGVIPPKFTAPTGEGEDAAIRLEYLSDVPDRPLLAGNRVRYQGQPVAVVVAEDRYAASNALDVIDVDYDRLDAVTEPAAAPDPDAAQIHPEAPDNVAYDWEIGRRERVDEAFDAADRTVSIDHVNQRIAPTPMEPRAALATYSADGKLTVRISSQIPHDHRDLFASTLGLDEDDVRVVVPEVGGGFGVKAKYHPEELLAAWCSIQTGRPVKWQATRSGSFAADMHGRGHDSVAEMAVDDDGTFRALRVETYVDMGAFLQKAASFISTRKHTQALSQQYAFPDIHCRVIGTFTNKSPMDAFRGAGRPEAAFTVERLVKKAADELGMDPVDVRRKNLIPPDAFPYRTPVGSTYDSGNYEAALDKLLENADYDSIRERRERLRDRGRHLGVGVCCFVEAAGVSKPSSTIVRVYPDGRVTASLDTADQGQGHRTTFAQVLAEELGVGIDDVTIEEGDTARDPEGTGTFAARSALAGGTALVEGAGQVVARGRQVAAEELEVAAADVEFADGEFRIVGAPDRSVPLERVAEAASPDGESAGIEVTATTTADFTYPFGAHLAVVEVDPESGEIDLQRYVAVDDCGNQINPTVVEGQIHGGIVQGIGQALYEEVVYDDNGSLVTGTMQNYALPRAEHVPELETDDTVTPTPTNPLGVKGAAESGIVGPQPAIVNAVVDALEPYGVEHIDMPLTEEAVWRAVDDAGGDG